MQLSDSKQQVAQLATALEQARAHLEAQQVALAQVRRAWLVGGGPWAGRQAGGATPVLPEPQALVHPWCEWVNGLPGTHSMNGCMHQSRSAQPHQLSL